MTLAMCTTILPLIRRLPTQWGAGGVRRCLAVSGGAQSSQAAAAQEGRARAEEHAAQEVAPAGPAVPAVAGHSEASSGMVRVCHCGQDCSLERNLLFYGDDRKGAREMSNSY